MYYFEDKDKDAELKKILDEWLNTPFRHHCGVKGLGCDCIHFVKCVFEELGLIKNAKKVPDYPRDWHLHNTREMLSEELPNYLNVVKIELNAEHMNGDIILSHYGKAASHAGLLYGPHVYQALEGIGVKRIHFADKKFRKQMKFICRILK